MAEFLAMLLLFLFLFLLFPRECFFRVIYLAQDCFLSMESAAERAASGIISDQSSVSFFSLFIGIGLYRGKEGSSNYNVSKGTHIASIVCPKRHKKFESTDDGR